MVLNHADPTEMDSSYNNIIVLGVRAMVFMGGLHR